MGAGLDARASRGAFAALNAGGAEPDARSAIRLRRRSSAHEISPSAPSHASSSFVVRSVEPLRSSCANVARGRAGRARRPATRRPGRAAHPGRGAPTACILKWCRAGTSNSSRLSLRNISLP